MSAEFGLQALHIPPPNSRDSLLLCDSLLLHPFRILTLHAGSEDQFYPGRLRARGAVYRQIPVGSFA